MIQINDIRKAFYEESMDINQIDREYGVDRKTVRIYINKTGIVKISSVKKYKEFDDQYLTSKASSAIKVS